MRQNSLLLRVSCSRTHRTVFNGEQTYQVIYIHAASIDYKEQGSTVLITIRCEKKN